MYRRGGGKAIWCTYRPFDHLLYQPCRGIEDLSWIVKWLVISTFLVRLRWISLLGGGLKPWNLNNEWQPWKRSSTMLLWVIKISWVAVRDNAVDSLIVGWSCSHKSDLDYPLQSLCPQYAVQFDCNLGNMPPGLCYQKLSVLKTILFCHITLTGGGWEGK